MNQENKNSNGFNPNIERGDNLPIVVSKYGFKDEVIDGKTYLVAMTKEEYLEAVKLLPNMSEEKINTIVLKIENDVASCYMYTRFACSTSDNCQMCSLGNVGTSYFCYCNEL